MEESGPRVPAPGGRPRPPVQGRDPRGLRCTCSKCVFHSAARRAASGALTGGQAAASQTHCPSASDSAGAEEASPATLQEGVPGPRPPRSDLAPDACCFMPGGRPCLEAAVTDTCRPLGQRPSTRPRQLAGGRGLPGSWHAGRIGTGSPSTCEGGVPLTRRSRESRDTSTYAAPSPGAACSALPEDDA